MKILIECICCHECFESNKISYKSCEIPSVGSIEELEDFAEESGAEFDCPSCEERMYLSDCGLF